MGLTDDAEDVTNVGHKDDEQVDGEEQCDGDANVPSPVEGLIWEQQLQNRPPDLGIVGTPQVTQGYNTQLLSSHVTSIWVTDWVTEDEVTYSKTTFD